MSRCDHRGNLEHPIFQCRFISPQVTSQTKVFATFLRLQNLEFTDEFLVFHREFLGFRSNSLFSDHFLVFRKVGLYTNLSINFDVSSRPLGLPGGPNAENGVFPRNQGFDLETKVLTSTIEVLLSDPKVLRSCRNLVYSASSIGSHNPMITHITAAAHISQ